MRNDEEAYQKVQELKKLCYGTKQETLERVTNQMPEMLVIIKDIGPYIHLPR